VVLEDALKHGVGGRFTAIRKGVRAVSMQSLPGCSLRLCRTRAGVSSRNHARGGRRHVRGMALGFTAWHTAHCRQLLRGRPPQSRTVLGPIALCATVIPTRGSWHIQNGPSMRARVPQAPRTSQGLLLVIGRDATLADVHADILTGISGVRKPLFT